MNDNEKPNDFSPESGRGDFLTLLSEIYLEAGLPLEFAVRSAIADYQLFEEEILCAP